MYVSWISEFRVCASYSFAYPISLVFVSSFKFEQRQNSQNSHSCLSVLAESTTDSATRLDIEMLANQRNKYENKINMIDQPCWTCPTQIIIPTQWTVGQAETLPIFIFDQPYMEFCWLESSTPTNGDCGFIRVHAKIKCM